jgi:2-polyprenyl-3-methyl-5-hydroxy-6-metoxy-1,4-benzoquinol methylase
VTPGDGSTPSSTETSTHIDNHDREEPVTTTTEATSTDPTQDPAIDPEAVEAFGDWFAESLNRTGAILMSSVAHRTGLFDAMADGRAGTSEEIADRASLEERYVRECLAALATAGIVEMVDEERYRLPAEKAALLTRDAEENLAVIAQFAPILGQVEDDVVACFREGGGVPYERYGRFHEVMAEDSGQTVVAALHDHILPLVPGLSDRLEEGIRVLDVGCGRGRALAEMARRYPESEFVGYDLSEEAVAWARDRASREGLENVRYEVRDVSDFDETAKPDAFDFVTTFDAIHDQKDPAAVLRGIARTLRADGVYLMQDIRASSQVHENLDHPLGTILYTVSCMHCMTVSLAQGGEGLGTMWGRERATSMLEDAGFGEVEIHEMDHDIQNDYYVVRH